MDEFNGRASGIDLADASAVDQAFAALQSRVQRAEGLLAGALQGRDMTAASPAPVDMTTAATSAAAIRRMTPRQKTAWVQSRAREVGPEQTRQEMMQMAAASAEEYRGVLHQSGLRYGNLR